jgi:hypothetical protein
VISTERPNFQERTTLVDYTGRTKGSSLDLLAAVLRVDSERISIEPTAEREVDFRVVLGGSYSACTYAQTLPLTE